MAIKSVLAPVGRFIARAWAWLDTSRRFVFNLLWLLILIALVSALLKRDPEPLQDKTTLVLNLQGRLVEQHSGSPRERLEAELRGSDTDQTQLRDVLRVLKHAAQDAKISQLLLDLNGFAGGGQAGLHELQRALTEFKKSGKKIVAYGDGFDQRGYQLASQADEIYLHPMGMVLLEGFGRYRNYYKDLFERVGVSANVLRAGKYKNFGEPYFTNGPSDATKESEGALYGDLWQRYLAGVEAARKLEKGAVTTYIETLPARMTELKGDTAQLALQAKLVDGIKNRDEVRALLMERGAKDEKGHSFRRVDFKQYLAHAKEKPVHGKHVAVVVAEGEIVDGSANPGRVGGDSTAALVRQAREDKNVAAVVLRVNSPGGSAFASDLIRRELELTRKAGKPVVISMGDVAASGGYWVSMDADEVIAHPSTITGSIGVFGMLPTADKLLEKLPVHTGGVATTWLVGAGDPRRPLDPRVAQAVQAGINRIYIDFVAKTAAARKKTPEQIDAVAQGRVWTGQQALEVGLVDRLGLLDDAIAAAAKRAKLEGKPAVQYVEKERSFMARVVEDFGSSQAAHAAAWVRTALDLPRLPAPMREAAAELSWLTEAQQAAPGHAKLPGSVHVHCLCTAP
ncbi:signal peptide peptidase SppA [Inhella proteolytica]|uniref:Signal peptide peptidase SppA n=1 Tax=Inhella proteolytica TaxID=2795029 RepID=A0A931J8R2_9BURK|nr:signal peptide peptidase SppA [Inhella proteolytica]MBH9578452.1 signal peptide peptidase SppA [Inhella proteolytica]